MKNLIRLRQVWAEIPTSLVKTAPALMSMIPLSVGQDGFYLSSVVKI
jgi:hypothetical protein